MHCYNIIHSIFATLKVLLPSAYSSVNHPTHGKRGSFTVFTALPFIECQVVGIIAFSDWLLPHRKMHLKFFHVFLWLDDSLFFSAESLHCLCVPQFIHAPIEGCFSCFQILAIRDKAAKKQPCAGFCVDIFSSFG